MNRPFKPEGYLSVSAYVMANGAQRVIDFLKATPTAVVG
jgi:PhnB protein